MAATTDGPPPPDPTSADAQPEALRAARTPWSILTGTLGVIGGLTPHVLHHVGPLVETALVAGAGGTILFGALGLAASIPTLLMLRRRFRSWWAPGVALLAFTGLFLVSSLVIGPLISGAGDAPTTDTPRVHDDSHHD